MKLFRFGLTLLLAGLNFAWAHDPGLGTAEVTIQPQSIEMTLGLAPSDLGAVVRHQGLATPVGSSGWNAEDFAAQKSVLLGASANFWKVEQNGTLTPPQSRSAWLESSNSVRIKLVYPRTDSGGIILTDTAISGLPAGHRDYLAVTDSSGRIQVERLVDAATGPISVILDSRPTASAAHTFWAFLRLGVMHIWTGYDHLLFLFGLLLVCRSFRTVAGIISCFTIAHSLTLALSTLGIVTISSRFIEPAIAASIVFVGIENLVRRGREPVGRWALTFAFGLIHGFGFASALRELGVGADGRRIALPLFTFNLGVELGQIAIAALLLPLLWRLRERPAFRLRGVPALSSVVAGAGLIWLLQRTIWA